MWKASRRLLSSLSSPGASQGVLHDRTCAHTLPTMAKRTSEAPPGASVPPEVLALVERFADNREAYRRGAYNEAQLRREFIDPLFKALGWDIDNTAGYAEAYKDVIHEDSIRIGGAGPGRARQPRLAATQ